MQQRSSLSLISKAGQGLVLHVVVFFVLYRLVYLFTFLFVLAINFANVYYYSHVWQQG